MQLPQLFSLKGQAALVTGGGAGIGRAICLMYAEAGANVACTDLNEADASAVARECSAFGVRSVGFRLDVTNESERIKAVSRVVSELGKLSILVNNAGGVQELD